MKLRAFLLTGAIPLIAALTIACSNGDDDRAPATGADAGGGAAGIVPAAGELIAPGQYLTFEGKRYELVNLLFEDLSEGEFEVIGEASQSDVDVQGDLRVFRRDGDPDAVYTYSARTVEDPAYWLAWAPAN